MCHRLLRRIVNWIIQIRCQGLNLEEEFQSLLAAAVGDKSFKRKFVEIFLS